MMTCNQPKKTALIVKEHCLNVLKDTNPDIPLERFQEFADGLFDILATAIIPQPNIAILALLYTINFSKYYIEMSDMHTILPPVISDHYYTDFEKWGFDEMIDLWTVAFSQTAALMFAESDKAFQNMMNAINHTMKRIGSHYICGKCGDHEHNCKKFGCSQMIKYPAKYVIALPTDFRSLFSDLRLLDHLNLKHLLEPTLDCIKNIKKSLHDLICSHPSKIEAIQNIIDNINNAPDDHKFTIDNEQQILWYVTVGPYINYVSLYKDIDTIIDYMVNSVYKKIRDVDGFQLLEEPAIDDSTFWCIYNKKYMTYSSGYMMRYSLIHPLKIQQIFIPSRAKSARSAVEYMD
jgi:hypothetical protein